MGERLANRSLGEMAGGSENEELSRFSFCKLKQPELFSDES